MSAELTAQVLAFSLVLTRVAAFVTVMPVFRRELVPRVVKLGLVFALSLVWWRADTLSGVPVNPSLPLLGLVLIREACLGAALGFLMGLFLLPTQIAGSWLSQELGLSLASMSDPVSQESSTIMSQILSAAATLAFLSLDLHHYLFAALGLTFAHIPFGRGLDGEFFSAAAVDGLATGHEIGMTIAAPVGVLLFLITVVLFLLNRASPQLNLFSIGLPLRLAAGFLALLVLLPETLVLITRSMQLMIDRMFAIL